MTFPLPPLTDAQGEVIERVARRARASAPRASRYDAESSFPYENYADLHRERSLALTAPREYGGLDADPIGEIVQRGALMASITSQFLELDLQGFALGYAVVYFGIG